MTTDLLNLGELYVSDFLAPGEEPRAERAELRLVMDDDGLVHLASQPAPELMWGRYWYRSGTNQTMRAQLKSIVEEIRGVVTLEPSDLWVDIASNDGTLLSYVPLGVVQVGVDPVEDDIYDEAVKHADWILQEPFTTAASDHVLDCLGRRAKVVTCIAMFYDLMDPTDFLAGVHRLLADDGVFVLQVSYTPLMLEQLAFDNICHEHARYYTLTTLTNVLNVAGFAVVDCQLNDTNGGSMRVYAQHQESDPDTFATRPYRDVAHLRTCAIFDYEYAVGYNNPATWARFAGRLERLRHQVYESVATAKGMRHEVWAYGASTKGNTLLQYFGLDHTMIHAIAERQEAKWGLRTVGTDIPIVSEDEWRKANPLYTLMLPWHFVSSFVERESAYLAGGGRFVVPCPKFQIIQGPASMMDGQRPA